MIASPVSGPPRPLIRGNFRYTDAAVIIPPMLVESLRCFDGESTDLELREALVRITGELQVGDIEKNIIETLGSSGFLDDENYARMRDERHREFAAESTRQPSHAGAAYPAELEPARETLRGWMDGATPPSSDGLIGIAAPHVSPEGGWRSYQAAYGALAPQYKDRTFVILGTSHYGEPERFGLTRKPYVTPFGETSVDLELVDALAAAAPDAVEMEDYCHAVEHSIEFQALFLQYIYGPNIRIAPILCGSYAHSIYLGGAPEANENVRRFLGALGDLAAKEGDRLFWVLGIDMAHKGRRYHDRLSAIADRGEMAEVAVRDKQ